MKSLLLMMILLLSFISCDSADAPALEGSTQPICEGATGKFFGACVPLMDWKLHLKSRAYPKAVSVFVNEKMIFNECSGGIRIATIDRTTAYYPVISLKQYFAVDATQTINLLVRNCNDLSVSYQNTVQRVETPQNGNIKFVLIEI